MNRRYASPLFFIFFAGNLHASQKSGLEVPAPPLRERVNNKPRDDGGAAMRLARKTTQPVCEFILVLDALALP